jgi:hypothetical protein
MNRVRRSRRAQLQRLSEGMTLLCNAYGKRTAHYECLLLILTPLSALVWPT